MDIWLLYSIFPGRTEALSVARRLVEERLVACVNICDGITSVYRWEDSIQEDGECLLLAKTTAEKVDHAISRIRQLHGYDIPCITSWPLAKGHDPFLQWVSAETADPL